MAHSKAVPYILKGFFIVREVTQISVIKENLIKKPTATLNVALGLSTSNLQD